MLPREVADLVDGSEHLRVGVEVDRGLCPAREQPGLHRRAQVGGLADHRQHGEVVWGNAEVGRSEDVELAFLCVERGAVVDDEDSQPLALVRGE